MSDRALSSLTLELIFVFLMLILGYGLLCFVVVACCFFVFFFWGGRVIFIFALGLCYAFFLLFIFF